MALLFALDLVLVLGFAYGLTAVFRPPTRPRFLVSAFILVWAELVFTALILSLLHLVTPGGMLAGHAPLALAALVLWQTAGLFPAAAPGVLHWTAAGWVKRNARLIPALG